MFKKIIATIAAIVLVVSVIPTTVWALTQGDENSFVVLGGEVTVDGSSDQTIDIVFAGTETDTYAYFQGEFAKEDATQKIKLTGMTAGYPTDLSSYVTPETGTFKFINELDGLTTDANAALVTATYTVDKDTPAGQYAIEMTLTTSSNFDDEMVKDKTYTAIITVKEAPTADYTTSLSADKEPINVDETVMVSVTVDGKVGEFASSQLVFAYDTNYLTFDAEGSELNGASASDNDGTITLVDHGDTQNNGIAYQLAFKGKAVTDTDSVITLTSAAFDKEANAPTQNIPIFTPDAATNTVSVAVVEKRYEVTLHEYFETEDDILFVEEGGAFTFSAKDPNYKYTVTVNEGTYTAVFDDATGKWTVSNVQEDLTITATREAKTFDVSIDTEGNFDPVPTIGENVATYKQNYTFTLKSNDTDYIYSLVSIKIGGVDAPAGSYTNTDKVYTILGDYITGDIDITTTATKRETYTITISAPNGVLKSSAESVKSGTEVTLTLTPQVGYSYTVTINNKPIALTENKYTAEVTENWDVVVIAELELTAEDVIIKEYFSINAKSAYVIQITAGLEDGYAYIYDEDIMFWSAMYNENNGAYVIMVIQDVNAVAPTFDTVKGNISVRELEENEEIKEIDYSGDVNMAGDGTVDANDAQLVWNIYNGKRYTSFTMLPMEKFLRADVDADGDVDVDDAAKIVTIIQGN